MELDTDRYPEWAWLLLGLFVAAVLANLLNVVLALAGLPETYFVVTIIAAMAPVVIFMGVHFREDRRGYWDHSRARILSDLAFVVVTTALGAAFVVAALADSGLYDLLVNIVAMSVGFVAGWALFYWRNPEIYRGESN